MGNPGRVVCGVLALSVAAGLQAQDSDSNATVRRGPAPPWVQPSDPLPIPDDASGLAFIRRQDTLVHLDAAGQQTYVGQRVRLLHPQSLQLGNVAIAWNPAVGAPTLHVLRVHRDDQTIDLMEAAKFEVLRREDQLEQAMLSGVLTAVLKIPDLRVGDDLELEYSLPSGDATLREQSAGLLALSGATLPGRYRLGLSWDAGQTPQFRSTEDFGAAVVRAANSLGVTIDNPPQIVPPKNAPPRFAWQRVIEFTDFPSWAAVSQRFAPLYAAAAQVGAASPLKQEAARIAAAHADPAARAQAALRLVQEQVRYIYVGLDGGNFRPATADETWQRRYGDCKGKTVLLLALLAELGIPAQAVLVSNLGADDGLDRRLPSPGMFDHVLVRATIGKQTFWLDGTMPGVVEMRTQPLMPYRWALPLTAAGSPLDPVPQEPPALPVEMGLFEIDARAGFDKPARKVETMVKRGLDGVAEYMQLSALSPDQLTQAFQNAAAGGSEWDAIEKVSYRYDRETQASVLSIVGSGPVDWDKGEDGTYSLILPRGGFSPPERRQRPADQDQAAPYYTEPGYSCHATTVRLPDATDLADWGFNSVFDTMMYGRLYYRMMERRDDRTIRMVRASRAERTEIPPETARRDNGRLERFDNSMARISYDPSDPPVPWGVRRPVAATYEIDWVGPKVPCLPEDLKSLR